MKSLVAALLSLSAFVAAPLAPSVVHAAPISAEPGRVLYQIYLESFQDGALRDGNGDFAGFEGRLDYLKDLGVTAVLLMPPFNSSGGMGYMVNDFNDLREDYGASKDPAAREAAFRRALGAAHARGIKVLLDIPINHISNASRWFRDSQAQVPGFENYFHWEDQPLAGWRIPWDDKSTPADVWHRSSVRKQYYYGLFGTGMPDLNHAHPDVQAGILAILSRWAAMGVDGFRIDAAKHLVEGKDNLNPLEPGNLQLIKYYLSELRKSFPDQSFLLEVWAGYDQFEPYLPESGDVAFDFAYMSALRDSSIHNHPFAVRNALSHLMDVQDHLAPGNRIVFVGNHDMARLRTVLGNSQPRAEIAQASTLLLPFTPLIYYGDEIFMPGEYVNGRDPRNGACTPMAWTPDKNAGFADPSLKLSDAWNKKIHGDWRTFNVETESGDRHSFLNFVRETLAARKKLHYTNAARFFVKRDNGSDPVLKYAVRMPDGCCMVGVFNYAQAAASVAAAFAGACEGQLAPLVARRASRSAVAGQIDLQGFGFWAGSSGCDRP